MCQHRKNQKFFGSFFQKRTKPSCLFFSKSEDAPPAAPDPACHSHEIRAGNNAEKVHRAWLANHRALPATAERKPAA
jgi:hypothetical protein